MTRDDAAPAPEADSVSRSYCDHPGRLHYRCSLNVLLCELGHSNGRRARASSTGGLCVSRKSGPAAVLCCCTSDPAGSRASVSDKRSGLSASLPQHPADTPNRSTSQAQPFQASNHVPPNQGPVWVALLRPDARWSTDSDNQGARRTRMWAGVTCCQSRVSVPPATMMAASDKEGLEWDGG